MPGNFVVGLAGIVLLFGQDVFVKLAGLLLVASAFMWQGADEPKALMIFLAIGFVIGIVLKATHLQQRWERFLHGPTKQTD